MGKTIKGTTENFIIKAKLKHGNKYDYSLVKYKNNFTKIKIICSLHNVFEQAPANHLTGQGCPICGSISTKNKQSLTHEQFISKSKLKHGEKFNYSLVNYVNNLTHVEIICPLHGIFRQSPSNHFKYGCLKCNTTGTISELKLINHLKKTLSDVLIVGEVTPKWLGKQRLDIYLPDHNIAIEYQGLQHFKEIKFFGGGKGFIRIKKADERKRLLCEANGCKLFYFTYTAKDVPADYPHKVYTDEQKLITEIKECFVK